MTSSGAHPPVRPGVRRLALALGPLLVACGGTDAASDATSTDTGAASSTGALETSTGPAGETGSTTAAVDGDTSGQPATGGDDPTTGGDDPTTSSGSGGVATSGTDSGPASVCGDAVVEGDEQCDDGNLDDGDTCTATCISPFAVRFDETTDETVYEYVQDVAFDDDGNLYVVVDSEDDVGPVAAYVVRYAYASPGSWTKDWTWSVDGDVAYLHGIAIDGDGRIVAVGNEPYALAAPGAMAFLLDRDTGTAVGDPLVFPCESGEGFKDFYRAAFLPDGNLVAGVTRQDVNLDYMPGYFLAFDPESGAVAWTTSIPEVPVSEYNEILVEDDTVRAIGRGDIFDTWAVELSTAGTELAWFGLGDIQGLGLARAGGQLAVPAPNDGVIAYDDDFTQQWIATAPVANPDTIAGNADGRVFAAGREADMPRLWIEAFEADGTLAWSDVLADPAQGLRYRLTSWGEYVAAVGRVRDEDTGVYHYRVRIYENL